MSRTQLDEEVDAVGLDTGRAPPAGATRSRLKSLVRFRSISWLVTLAMACLVILPLGVMGLRVLWSGGEFNASGVVRDTLSLTGFGSLIVNTLLLVVVGSALALVFGSLLAWIATKTDASLPVFGSVLPVLPYFMPPIAGAVGWVLLLSPQSGYINGLVRIPLNAIGIGMESGPLDIFTWYGLIGIFTIYQVPLAFMLVAAGLRSIHASQEEQSRVCGAGNLETFVRITLPSLKPSIGAAGILLAWHGFSFFSVPFIIGYQANIDVISVRLVRLMTFTYPPNLDAALGLTIIITGFVAITWFLQVRVLKGGRFSSITGQGLASNIVRLGKWRWPLRLFVLIYAGIAVVLPVLALVLVSVQGFWSSRVRWGEMSINSFLDSVVGHSATRDALTNSLQLAIIGATVGIIIAMTISWTVGGSGGFLRRSLDGVLKLPATVPNIVIAVGLLIALGSAPVYLQGTLLILLIGYVVAYLPQGSVAADAARSQVGSELTEASLTEGAGIGTTFRRIQVPLMIPGLAVGWALLFARMVGDLTVSAILAGPGTQVAGFRLLEISNAGSYADLASLALSIAIITTVVVAGVMKLSKVSQVWEG